ARIYDMKLANKEAMSFEERGERYSIYYLMPKTREDLARRSRGHRMIAELTYGMFGRSPDHVASFVTGMAMKPDELRPPYGNGGGLLRLSCEVRKAQTHRLSRLRPPPAARDPQVDRPP